MSLIKNFLGFAHTWWRPTDSNRPDGPLVNYEVQPVVQVADWRSIELPPYQTQLAAKTAVSVVASNSIRRFTIESEFIYRIESIFVRDQDFTTLPVEWGYDRQIIVGPPTVLTPNLQLLGAPYPKDIESGFEWNDWGIMIPGQVTDTDQPTFPWNPIYKPIFGGPIGTLILFIPIPSGSPSTTLTTSILLSFYRPDAEREIQNTIGQGINE